MQLFCDLRLRKVVVWVEVMLMNLVLLETGLDSSAYRWLLRSLLKVILLVLLQLGASPDETRWENFLLSVDDGGRLPDCLQRAR